MAAPRRRHQFCHLKSKKSRSKATFVRLRSATNRWRIWLGSRKFTRDRSWDLRAAWNMRFNRLRNTLAADFPLHQRLNDDDTVLVTAGRIPTIPSGSRFRVARPGDMWLDWALNANSVTLPTSKRHDNGDALQLELTWVGHSSSWLQFAPFNPPLDKDVRDRTLLQGMLGLAIDLIERAGRTPCPSQECHRRREGCRCWFAGL